jgi:hypothetical protein
MKKIVYSILTVIIFINSCNSPIEPEPQPGRRDYVWTVDTLIIPFTKLYSISGSAPNDVWAVGPGGGLDKTIWHFDGTSWKTDGKSRSISPESIFAIAKNNVWIGGQNGKIWNYDGFAWKEIVRFILPGEKNIFFYRVWGDSPKNIFATGFALTKIDELNSVIARYDGFKWELIEFPNLKYQLLRMNRGIKDSWKYYLMGIENKPDGGEIFGLFEWDGNKNIKQIFRGSNGQESWCHVQQIENRIFFGIGSTIYKYKKLTGEFTPFLKVNDMNFWTGFFGRSEKDIFLIMAYGVTHYNGTDIEYLYKNPNKIHILDAVIFEKEVFFLVVDPSIGGNLIIRGKLK